MPNWNTHRHQLMTQTLCKIRSRVRLDLGRPKSFWKNWEVFWSLWRVAGKVLHSQFSGYFIQDVNPARYSKTAIDKTSTSAGKMQFWGWICWVVLEVFHPCLHCIFRVPFNGSIPSDEYLTKCVNSASARLQHQNALDDHLTISQGVMVLCVYTPENLTWNPKNMKLWKMIFPLELGMMFRFQLILFQGVKLLWPFNKRENHPPPHLGEHEATNHNQVGKHFEKTALRASPKLASCSNSLCNLQVWGKKWIFVDDQKMLGPWVLGWKSATFFWWQLPILKCQFLVRTCFGEFFQREFPWGFLRTEASCGVRLRWRSRLKCQVIREASSTIWWRLCETICSKKTWTCSANCIYIYYRQVQKALNKKKVGKKTSFGFTSPRISHVPKRKTGDVEAKFQ